MMNPRMPKTRNRRVATSSTTRTIVLATALAIGAGPFNVHSTCAAQSNDEAKLPTAETLTDVKIVERTTMAVERALSYLASNQVSAGGWNDNHAINALCCLAFMGAGHAPDRGPYKEALARTRRRILASQNAQGVYVSSVPSHGPMYEHALSTLAISEMYGMDPDPKIESSLRRAVGVIVSSQASNGGWRYQPQPSDHDLSVSVMQIVAIRSASNSQIPVPDDCIKRAVEYVKSCSTAEGGFGYRPGDGRKPEMTAAGILSLQLLGRHREPEIPKALDYMTQVPVKWEREQTEYFFYFHYYAMQAAYQAGGKHWNSWHPKIRELLLSHQNTDGSWNSPPNTAESRTGNGVVGMSKAYWTAMSCLVLEVYMHYLPAYQR